MEKNNSTGKFDGIWNIRRFIKELSNQTRLANGIIAFKIEEHDTSHPDYIKMLRLESVMRAYGHEVFLSWCKPSMILMGLPSFNISAEKRKILDSLICEIGNEKISEIQEENLPYIFMMLFKYYVALNELSGFGKNIIAGNSGICYVLDIADSINNNRIYPIKEKILDILVLLMGDEFDKIFTEEELINGFDYPTVTDAELLKMTMEYFY